MLKLFTFLVLFITSILSAAPTFQAAGTYVNGTTNITPTWPAHSINDLALLFVETRGGQAVNLSTPAGFTQVLNSPQDVPSTGGFFFSGTSYGTRLTVFWARATSASMSAPVIQDPGNHVGAQILTYRGVITSGNPWDVTAGSTKTTASTSISAPAVTTTVNDTLIVQAVSRDTDSANAAFSNQTNAALTMIAERVDTGTSTGDGGGFSVWDGGKAVAGATGSTSATVSSSKNAMLTIALKPNSPPVITAPNNGNTYSASIPENTTAVTDVNATDPDTGQTLTYSLSGTDAAKFTIDASTGVVTFTTAPDFEVPTDNGANNVYDFTVTVTDNGSPAKADTQDFHITVTDVNELPIADYRLDECSWNGTVAQVKDSSGNNLNGTAINGATTITNGKINNSSDLNPTTSTQYIEIPNNNLLNGTNKLTLTGWINPSTYTPINGNALGVLSKRVSSGSEYAYGVFMGYAYSGCAVDKLSIDIDGSDNRFCTNSSIPLNQWTHFAVTYDGTLTSTQRVKVYLNGVLDKTATENSTTISNSTAPLRIGSLYESVSEPKAFKGKIDEIKIYNQSLSTENINTIYSNENIGKNYNGTTRTASCCCLPTGGNLLANPSFETLCQSTIIETWTGIEGGTVNMRNNVCGWNMNGSGMETWENTTSKPASDGTVFVEIDGYNTTVDKLWQNLNTVNGTNYIIRFDYRKRNGTNAGSDIIIAKWNDVAITQVEGNTLGWQTAEIQVTGTASPDKLSFEEPASANDSLGSWIDNIRVVEGTLATNCTSFKYEPYHSYNVNLTPSYRLHTRLANQSFDVNVTVACAGNGTIPARQIKNIYAIDASATSCNASTPKLATLLSNGSYTINDTNKVINIPNLNSTKAYSNVKLMLETNTSEFNCSTDTMAIRPASFTVTTPIPLKAEQFTLTASAINSGGGYNGTGSVSTTLQTPNSECPISSNFLTFGSTPLHFTADTNTTKANATDVGIIILNLKDTTWTAVDQTADCIPDSNSTLAVDGKFGCNIENNMTMTITPHHFDVNATLSNAVTGYTYLSTDLNMSAQLDLNITAKTADGNTTKNYTTGCYAKVTNYTINYTAPAITLAANLTKLNYFETNTSTSDNVATTANAFNLNNLSKTIFGSDTNGSAKLSVKINFDRNSSKPVNPFDLNISSVIVTDTDSVIGTTLPTGNATFVYGRVHTYDIKTDQPSAPNPIELEVYSSTSSGYVTSMPQNILHWYRNLNHDNNLTGSIFSGSTNIPSITVDVYANPPLNGLHSIQINYSQTAPITKTIHLNIPIWLWYSPTHNYNYNGNCTQHPCFDYQFFGTSTGVITGVNSGTFQGSDFNLAPARKVIKKGVKVFR